MSKDKLNSKKQSKKKISVNLDIDDPKSVGTPNHPTAEKAIRSENKTTGETDVNLDSINEKGGKNHNIKKNYPKRSVARNSKVTNYISNDSSDRNNAIQHNKAVNTDIEIENDSELNNSISGVKAWVLASRPRTLTASLSPVVLACVLAYKDGVFKPAPAILCFLVAIFAQIASNFSNDYFDYMKGSDDEDRLGPARAVASGWIKPHHMIVGTVITLILVAISGLGLVYYAGYWLLFAGVAIILCVLAYSAGPFPLAYNGLGDLCVLIFYGIVPLLLTYYVQAGSYTLEAFLLSVTVGMLSINLLLVNNYRDYHQDKENGKRTLVVIFGKGFAEGFHIVNSVLVLILSLPFIFQADIWIWLLFLPFAGLLIFTYYAMITTKGRELNSVLGMTARNILLYAILISMAILSTTF